MKKIGLIDYDGKIPNLALMKLSTYYKQQGYEVHLNTFGQDVEKVYCSVLFTWNKDKAKDLTHYYNNITFGGTGWDIRTTLPEHIEQCKPDYDLYTTDFLYNRNGGIMKKESRLKKVEELINMGIGFTSRGCINTCPFCVVPGKEGKLHQVADIKDIINPRSKILTLLDNNFTADPYMLDKCQEIKQRDLTINLSQGIDVRVMTEEKAKALASIKHLRSIHYAWDLIHHEKQVIKGIHTLKKYIKPWRHMCYILVGFNTTFEEDYYRFRRLKKLKIKPFVMLYNKRKDDLRLRHFARWVNASICNVCNFEDYGPWMKAQEKQDQLELIS